MRRIKLTQGKFALVDDADFEWLNQWKWTASKDKGRWHALRFEGTTGNRKHVSMHSMLCDGGPEVDHKNGDSLDNRRGNLRPATRSQNEANKGKQRRKGGSSSRFKGVHFDSITSKWRACIRKNYRLIRLGRFARERDAAMAYDAAARQLFGEFAKTNFGGA